MDEHDLGAESEDAVPERRPGGWRLPVLGALAGVLALGGVAYAVQRDTGADSGRSAGTELPSPRTIQRGGVTFHVRPASGVAAAADPKDPSVVVVYATDVYQPEDPKCSFMEPTARVVHQSADEIRIATFDYGIPQKGNGSILCGYADAVDPDAEVPAGFAALRVRLDAPWKGRPLIDDATGKEIGVVTDLVAPEPGYLPAGYHVRDWPEGMEAPDESAMANDFFAGRTYLSGTATLDILVQSSSYAMDLGKTLGHDDVSGVRADLTESDYQRCVVWSPQHGVTAQVCSGGEGERLPDSELVRVAESLEFPS